MKEPKSQTFLLDWDGTMFNGSIPTKEACDFFNFLGSLNSKIIYFTNNSSKSCIEYEMILKQNQLWNASCQVLSSGVIAGWYIKYILNIRKVYIIGTESLIFELGKFGIVHSEDSAELLLLGYDKSITYEKIQKGYELITQGIPFYATHDDKICPDDGKSYIDCGSLIEIFRKASDINPIIIGKPYKICQDYVLEKCNLDFKSTILIGDKLETDGILAEKLGVKFLKVESNNGLIFLQDRILKIIQDG